jgi:hypothetical protein
MGLIPYYARSTNKYRNYFEFQGPYQQWEIRFATSKEHNIVHFYGRKWRSFLVSRRPRVPFINPIP